jgi:predicted nucleic acid-binding protein
MAEPFLDTNIFLRHLTGQPPEQAARATAYFKRIEHGDIRAVTVEMVIFEVVYTLQKSYRRSKNEIQEVFIPLIDLPGIALANKKHMHDVFDLYVIHNLPFADAYYIVTMKAKRLDTMISFDTDFDGIPGITRIEP